ncbi:MAG: hypothetical protein PUC74_09500 [Succinatimonas sp.]|jgi:hypothetical protein|nr:hypothetical protein [Succinatimonas sp.]MDD5869592.1 hypothetical protein [Succinatimonas sp.]MDY5722325.1 hypothetical protein [Succinivibrio sp.]
MSSVNANFGMESMNVAMLKRQNDSQGKIGLALLEGAVKNVEQTQAQAQANAPAPKVQPVVEGAKGANIDIMA